jgi:hypothetical protein
MLARSLYYKRIRHSEMLKRQSHEKVGEIRVWNISLGSN